MRQALKAVLFRGNHNWAARDWAAWADLIVADYEATVNPLSTVARERLRTALTQDTHYQTHFGDRTAADFLYVLQTATTTTARDQVKAGATLRWDIDGQITNSNTLPAYTRGANDGVIVLSSTDGFANLTMLDLQACRLIGTAPNFNLPACTQFWINNNQFSGTAPNWNLPACMQFWINNNQLSGVAPNWNLPACNEFRINNNRFSGIAPNWSLPTCTEFWINNNQLSGVAPNWNLPTCPQFRINNNQFSGVAPNWSLPACTQFWINNNQFSGIAPSWNLPACTQFRINNNQFSQLSGVTGVVTGSNNIKNIQTQSNLLTQASIDLLLNQYHTHRTAMVAATGNLTMQLGTGNAAPSATGLSNRADIISAFTAAGKTATIITS